MISVPSSSPLRGAEPAVPAVSFSRTHTPTQPLRDLALQSVRSGRPIPSTQLKWYQSSVGGGDVSRFTTNKTIVEDVLSGKIRLTAANLHRLNTEEAQALRTGIPLARIQADVRAAIKDSSATDSEKAVLSLLLIGTEDQAVEYALRLSDRVFNDIHGGQGPRRPVSAETKEKLAQFKQQLAGMGFPERLAFMAKWKLYEDADHLKAFMFDCYKEAFGAQIHSELRIAKHLAGDHTIELTPDEIKYVQAQLEKIQDPKACIDFMRTLKLDPRINLLKKLSPEKIVQFSLATCLQGAASVGLLVSANEKEMLKLCLSAMTPNQRLEWMATWKTNKAIMEALLPDAGDRTAFTAARRLQEIGNDLRSEKLLRLTAEDRTLFSQFFNTLKPAEKEKFLSQWEQDIANSPLKNTGIAVLFKMMVTVAPCMARIQESEGPGQQSDRMRVGEFIKSLEKLPPPARLVILSQFPCDLHESRITTIMSQICKPAAMQELRIAKCLGGDATIDLTEAEIAHIKTVLLPGLPKGSKIKEKMTTIIELHEKNTLELEAFHAGRSSTLSGSAFQKLCRMPLDQVREFLGSWKIEVDDPSQIKTSMEVPLPSLKREWLNLPLTHVIAYQIAKGRTIDATFTQDATNTSALVTCLQAMPSEARQAYLRDTCTFAVPSEVFNVLKSHSLPLCFEYMRLKDIPIERIQADFDSDFERSGSMAKTLQTYLEGLKPSERLAYLKICDSNTLSTQVGFKLPIEYLIAKGDPWDLNALSACVTINKVPAHQIFKECLLAMPQQEREAYLEKCTIPDNHALLHDPALKDALMRVRINAVLQQSEQGENYSLSPAEIQQLNHDLSAMDEGKRKDKMKLWKLQSNSPLLSKLSANFQSEFVISRAQQSRD